MKKYILALTGTMAILASILSGVYFVVEGPRFLGLFLQGFGGGLIYGTIYFFLDFLEAQK